jgi:hypothetical protein
LRIVGLSLFTTTAKRDNVRGYLTPSDAFAIILHIIAETSLPLRSFAGNLITAREYCVDEPATSSKLSNTRLQERMISASRALFMTFLDLNDI